MIITIDGPAGSGKSTVARKLAIKLAFLHLNSGALFRAVALRAKEKQLALDDDAAVARLARELNFQFELGENAETIFRVDGTDIRDQLTNEELGKLASIVGLLPSVRQCLLEVQREVGAKHSLVVEGRDSGTVVFPDAGKKFYLDASVDVRAKRRHDELKGAEAGLEALRDQIAERDRQDATRKIAPHYMADDAIRIDTSSLTPDEVVERIVGWLK